MYAYFDNAATTAVSQSVADAMRPYFTEVYGNPSSLHSVGQRAAEALVSARETVAKLLNAKPSEIYFTSGGSEAQSGDPVCCTSRCKKGQEAHHFHRF